MSVKLGLKAKLYRNTGSYSSPTWSAIGLIGDLTVTPEWDEAEGNVRDTTVKSVAKTLLGIEISGRVRVSNTDPGYLALRDAFYATTPIDLMILNGAQDENGSHGWRCDWHVMAFTEDQGLTNVIYADFSLKPAVSENPHNRAVVTSGAPVYTAM
jgi:hypothetical protein